LLRVLFDCQVNEILPLSKAPNRLIKEKSPYLLQHAYNPIDWYPWGEEAFTKASNESKLIFLSIGYSSCHWCHVMEKESFEDFEVASYLNENYVAIKVDREERPDVDRVYMAVCQALMKSGGWPLNLILTPDKKPVFVSTYLPKKGKWGRPGLIDVLIKYNDLWQNNREVLISQSEELINAVFVETTNGMNELDSKVLSDAFNALSKLFDPMFGGFSKAPKFPSPHILLFLLRYWKQTGNKNALMMVDKTLDAMHRGGIYDHIGFGFCRYSTDEKWFNPHFEKMLCDNALLAYSYIEGFLATGKKRYERIAREIFTYIERELLSPEGGFYCSEDADSNGKEGDYYLWSEREVMHVLGDELGSLFCSFYNLKNDDNPNEKNIPNIISTTPLKIAEEYGLSESELFKKIEFARQLIFADRERRPKPSKDDKILTSWNGLAIAALSKGAFVLKNRRYEEMAKRAADFVLSKLRRDDGRLLARYREGESAYLGYLDDYAYLIWGLLELYSATLEIKYLREAIDLNNGMFRLFWDENRGGLFFVGNDAEKVLVRLKEANDGALPSGNSVAALNMLKIARLTSNNDLNDKADDIFRAFSDEISKYPWAFSFMLMALQFRYSPVVDIMLIGNRDDETLIQILDKVRSSFIPLFVIAHSSPSEVNEVSKLIPILKNKATIDGKTTVYVCYNNSCQPAINDLQKMNAFLKEHNFE